MDSKPQAIKKITTAVFPVAGLGTRFLPITKSGPKEMLPIVDKPLIQYVVEEAIQVGITRIVLVTSIGKRAIEDYFDVHYELNHRLAERGKTEALATVNSILPSEVSVIYMRQAEPLGLGHAILCARDVVGSEPFAVLLADDIMEQGAKACLRQMVELYQQTGNSVLAVEEVPQHDTDKYGIISVKDSKANPLHVTGIVEKPKTQNAPSNLAVIGRYILTPEIFSLLETVQVGVGGEIQLTDGIAQLLKQQSVLATKICGVRHDCGDPLGLLKATITFAYRRSEFKEPLCAYMKAILQSA